jgi:hypothetical protein
MTHDVNYLIYNFVLCQLIENKLMFAIRAHHVLFETETRR